MSDAMKAETFVAPTELIEKLYGGAEKICDSVIDISTSHEMQMVNIKVAHCTTGLASMNKGRMKVLQNGTRSQKPDHGRSSLVYEMRVSETSRMSRLSSTCSTPFFSTSTALSPVSIFSTFLRWNAVSGIKKKFNRSISTNAPPIACIAIR